jgi:ATP-dependent DNA ligase
VGPVFQLSLPTNGITVPAGPEWLHEVKYDGYRMLLIRERDRVRLITRGGNDWTKRFPWIVEAARKIRTSQFVIDGEAVVLGVNGISDFNALHSRTHDDEVQFSSLLSDFLRSLDAARLADQDDPERSAYLDAIKDEARDANNIINKAMGWPVVEFRRSR